jgi:crotonobetainyl-CoA:carnitine CoA-transferase CaiB-like acyl-CoA transferase
MATRRPTTSRLTAPSGVSSSISHGILAALYERTRSGQRQRVSTTLLSAQIALHTDVTGYYWQSGQEPGPVGSAHASMVPYQAFRTSDSWIAVVAHTPKFYANFCTALGRPELISYPHFADLTAHLEHRAALLAVIDPIMASRNTAEWTERLVAADVPCGPVHSVGQVLADPGAEHGGQGRASCRVPRAGGGESAEVLAYASGAVRLTAPSWRAHGPGVAGAAGL